ncbi:MAG: HD domain-containing phosphohydrolase [Clostridiales bacterium]
MNIQRKTLIVIISTLTCLIFLIYLILRFIILNSFDTLEKNSLRFELLKISQSFNEEIEELNTYISDYKGRSDINDIQNNNTLSINNQNLKNLNINLMLLLNKDSIIHKSNFNLNDHQFSKIYDIFLKPSYIHNFQGNSSSGFIEINNEFYIFSRSTLKNHSNISLIFIRSIDKNFLKDFSYKLNMDIELIPLNSISKIAQKNVTSNSEYIHTNDNKTLSAYKLIKNYRNNSDIIIKVNKERLFYSYGNVTLNTIAIFILIAFTTMNIIIIKYLKITILSRIINLSKDVNSITNDSNMSLRVNSKGSDEIAVLSDNINNMLNSLHDSQNNYRLLFENMINSFSYCKALYEDNIIVDFIILEINEEFEKEWNIRKSDIIGNRISDIIPDLISSEYNLIESFVNVMNNSERLELELYDKNQSRWFNIYAFSPKKDYISTIYFNITKQKENEKIIKKIALSDSLTNLYNRRFFDEKTNYLNKHLEIFFPISIFSIDLDGLKIINDSLGHSEGDKLIKNVARILKKVFKDTHSIIRTGGDEFCIILTNTKESDANIKKIQLLDYVDQYNKRDTTKVNISMSIGLATSKTTDDNIYSIYVNADNKMYQYKLSQTESNKSSVIDILLTALSERDYVAEGHVERLVEMSKILSDAFSLSDEEKRNMILLAKMHDLGKIGIPDEILNKPGKLTDEEYEKMKHHSHIGFKIANRSKELSNIANLILHHHENWDGTGYPSELKKKEIPIECRILSIIDSYDAITSKRPYSNGMSKKDALEEIKKCSEIKFDPEIVKIFLGLVENGTIQYPKIQLQETAEINS